MSKKPKRPSVESKIAAEIYEKVRRLYPGGEGFDVSWIKKRIRSVVRRAVREAWRARGHWGCLVDNVGNQQAREFRREFGQKYGVTL